MKKSFLSIMIIAILATTITSCKKTEKTDTDYLCIKKGWVLESATSSPAYALSNGTYATDLMKDGYLYSYELDDILYFTADGAQKIAPGKLVDTDSTKYAYQTEVATTWKFNSDNTKLLFQIPFFYNDTYTSFSDLVEEAEILALNDEELRIKYTFNAVTKADTTYSFTLKYVPAK